MKVYKAWLIFWILLGIGFLLCPLFALLSYIFINSVILIKILLWLGFIIIVIAEIFRFFFGRCPSCGHVLNFHGFSPNYCPNCGYEFED